MSGRAEMPAGDQLGPLFDDWVVFYDDDRNPPDDNLVGKVCVCKLSDERLLIRRLLHSSIKGQWTLLPNDRTQPLEVRVEWAARLLYLQPASAAVQRRSA
jgi:hypothetical protein